MWTKHFRQEDNMARAGAEKALKLIKNLPRVTLGTLKPLPGSRRNPTLLRGRTAGHSGYGGQAKRNTLPRLGFQGGQSPFYLVIPKEPYYKGHHLRKHYTAVSLLELQRFIDLGHVDADQPIDLTSLCNTKIIPLDWRDNNHGVHITDEGADIFASQVNLEVQWVSEAAIAAIERNGGVVCSKFYDTMSVAAMADPLRFFKTGKPIPRCKLPSNEVLEYYSSAKNRGYLADPDDISQARIELAQKYGYKLPDLREDPKIEMLSRRKDARQIWYDLQPGWVVNLRDKVVLKPTDKDLVDYYKS